MIKGYREGTHRLVSPEATFARVQPHLDALEVTRLADVTGLDRLGVPVYCAIRPRGVVLQSTNGKGARAVDAQVSALMEAVEHHHAERPLTHLRRASARTLRAEGPRIVEPGALAQYRSRTYWSEDFVIDWAPAEELYTGGLAWVPASAVYSGVTPCLHDFTANGLASGNHTTEATLHALYEIIERDAISALSVDGRIRLTPPLCEAVQPSTLDGMPGELYARLRASEVDLVLLAVRTGRAAHTFWAILIDQQPFSPSSTVNVGYGTHLSPVVAAVRAITEAAQSRVCYIHGAREDLASKITTQTSAGLQRVAGAFRQLQATAVWDDFEDLSSDSLETDLRELLTRLNVQPSGAYRIDLTRPPFDIPVVKILVPGMRLNRRFF